MFTKSAQFYDAVYGFKDYAGESEQLLGLIEQYKRVGGEHLAGCGLWHRRAYPLSWGALPNRGP